MEICHDLAHLLHPGGSREALVNGIKAKAALYICEMKYKDMTESERQKEIDDWRRYMRRDKTEEPAEETPGRKYFAVSNYLDEHRDILDIVYETVKKTILRSGSGLSDHSPKNFRRVMLESILLQAVYGDVDALQKSAKLFPCVRAAPAAGNTEIRDMP